MRAIACVVVIGVVLALARATAADPVAELVVIVHADNHATASAADLEAWFLRKDRRWSDGSVVIPINEPPDATGRHVFDRAVLGMSPDEIARYWLDRRIRDGDNAPREIEDATVVARLVARIGGAIAYVPASAELHGVRVIARIRDGKVVAP